MASPTGMGIPVMTVCWAMTFQRAVVSAKRVVVRDFDENQHESIRIRDAELRGECLAFAGAGWARAGHLDEAGAA